MKFKNKLVKFNHKAPYYRMKKCAVSFAIFAGLAVSVSVPLTLTYMEQAPVAPHAEEKEESSNQVLDETSKQESSYELEDETLKTY